MHPKIKQIVPSHDSIKNFTFLKNLKKLFPNIELISAWGDANAQIMYDELQQKLGNIHIQKKGVLATEGIISIPLVNLEDGHVIAYKSHFFENF